MDLDVNNEEVNYICEGCLSSNRNISLCDVEMTKVYYEFLNQNALQHKVSLCWECKALLRKFVKFKHQVQIARIAITDFMSSPFKLLKSLSNLTVSDVCMEEILEPVKIQVETIQNDPIQFIKTEIESNFEEVIYVDSDQNRHNSNIEENKIPVITVKVECQNDTRENNSDSPINSSDELPVQKETKKRVRKRKKDVQSEPKVKKRKSKAEKPPGVVNDIHVENKLKQLNMNPGTMEKVVLSWEQVEEERQKALQSAAYTGPGYKCADCVLSFNYQYKLDNHLKKHDPSYGPIECPICKIRCKDSSALTVHKNRHRFRWRCVTCGGRWALAAACADHVARTHAHTHAQPVHICKTCGLTATSFAKLRNHMKDHGERQKCELCDKTFRDRNSLVAHLYIHKGEKQYSCSHCDKKFYLKTAMERHVKTHETSEHLYCYECKETYKNEFTYKQHFKNTLKHNNATIACEYCDKKFVNSIRLKYHINAVHLKVVIVKCKVEGCDFSCSSRTGLRTHTRTEHLRTPPERNKVCDTCGKAYMTKRALECHQRSHTGARPLECDACGANFAYPAALFNHIKFVHKKIKKGKSGKKTSDIQTYEANISIS